MLTDQKVHAVFSMLAPLLRCSTRCRIPGNGVRHGFHEPERVPI